MGRRFNALIIICTLLLVGCKEQPPLLAEADIQTPVVETETSIPTETPVPTATQTPVPTAMANVE